MGESDDDDAMRCAIEASRDALRAGDRPYGAVLVAQDGRRLHVGGNRQSSDADPTAHAEIVAVREAIRRHGAGALRGATAYASGEPCAMCAGALFWAGIRRVVFAVPNATMREVMGGQTLGTTCAEVLTGSDPPMRVDPPRMTVDALRVLREAAAADRARS